MQASHICAQVNLERAKALARAFKKEAKRIAYAHVAKAELATDDVQRKWIVVCDQQYLVEETMLRLLENAQRPAAAELSGCASNI
jgi:predicted nucleic acid-binding protein